MQPVKQKHTDLLETDNSNNDKRCYVYGNYIDEVLMMHYDLRDEDYYYAHDHLYSVVAMFDDGDVLERYEYDAYGNVHIMDDIYNSQGSSLRGNPYLFTGRRLDTLDSNNFNIYYYRARYYDAETGRFISRDPLGTDPGGLSSNTFRPVIQYMHASSLYEYIKSDPISGLDAAGTCPRTIGDPWLEKVWFNQYRSREI